MQRSREAMAGIASPSRVQDEDRRTCESVSIYSCLEEEDGEEEAAEAVVVEETRSF